MIRNATIYSVIVLAAATVGLLAVCAPDLVAAVELWLEKNKLLVTKIGIVLFALALVVCRWWRVWKQRRKPRACDHACPPSDSPYPDEDWKRITGFWYETDLCLARLKKRDCRFKSEDQYLVAKDYVVCLELDGSKNMTITVPRGAITDLASVPRPFRGFVGRVGPHLEASIVHDWLYVEWQKSKRIPTDDMRLFSDRVMLAGMLASGMGCKAYVIYWAIRVFGACIFYAGNPKPYVLEECKMPDCCHDEPTKALSS